MQMGSFATGRRVQKKVEGFELQESQSPYNVLFDTEKNDIEGAKTYGFGMNKMQYRNVNLVRPQFLCVVN